MMTVTYIMHQNRHTANEVGMEILDLKVIDKHRHVKKLNFRTEYGRGGSVKVVDLITLSKVTCGNPTFSNHIERVVGGRVNIALIGIEVQNLINRVNINLCNGFEFGFSGLNIICPNLVADLNLVNALLPTVDRLTPFLSCEISSSPRV